MNRRSFLRRVAAGTVGALAASALPASAFTATPALAQAAREACLSRLLALYREYYRTHTLSDPMPVFPVGLEFFAAYEGELVAHARFIDTDAGWATTPTLKFKGGTVVADLDAPPWDARVAGRGTIGAIVRSQQPMWRAS